jgi:zinc transport system substrate-binding protein
MIGKKFGLWAAAAGFGAAVVACGDGAPDGDNALIVSIEPLRYVVEEIVGDDFRVEVLLPPGATPETYEPTPLQISAAEDAGLVFSTGLIDFERIILGGLSDPERFVDLSAGVELIADGHGHGDFEARERGFGGAREEGLGEARELGRGAVGRYKRQNIENEHNTGQHGEARERGFGEFDGADPHIWLAPRALAQMARTAYGRIHELHPDSASYTANYEQLAEHLAALDREVSAQIAASGARAFVIFHPGLTYYARDYGLRQISLERDGKEPSARELAEIIVAARAEGISRVMYQAEFQRRTVEIAAAEIGAEPVEIDVLSYDVVANILKITGLIAGIGGDGATGCSGAAEDDSAGDVGGGSAGFGNAGGSVGVGGGSGGGAGKNN